MKLTEEQLEEVIQGQRPVPEDLDESQRRRLAEASAVRDRLRAAFQDVRAGESLAERIRLQLPGRGGRPKAVRNAWRLAPLAAAAAVLIVVAPLLIRMAMPSHAAAQAQLASIHHENLKPHGKLHRQSDRRRLAELLAQELGAKPALPRGDDVTFCGCCMARFGGKDVATYMVKLAGRRISIIIAVVDPETLGFGHKFASRGRTFWGCGHEDCRMVAMRLGRYTYFSVGKTSHENLTDVLVRLLPE